MRWATTKITQRTYGLVTVTVPTSISILVRLPTTPTENAVLDAALLSQSP
jgi:hypothetical protein